MKGTAEVSRTVTIGDDDVDVRATFAIAYERASRDCPGGYDVDLLRCVREDDGTPVTLAEEQIDALIDQAIEQLADEAYCAAEDAAERRADARADR